MQIEGSVAPGFESVKQLYEQNMRTLVERNTQLCVYVGTECVVDLWASAIDDASFSGDSLVNVFSSGKSLEAITMAMLVDRGQLEYNAKITDYWPEFAASSIRETTIADLMRHEAGLAAFDTTLDPHDLHPGKLKTNAVGAIIERQVQKFRLGDGKQREYHAITRGWIANEIFRRVEPLGRTMGQFLREEISEPLDADVFIGLHDHELPRINEVAMLGFGYQFLQGLRPKAMGRKMELNLAQTIAKFWRLRAGMKNRTTAGSPVPISGMKKLSVLDTPALAKGEIPSAGAKCSARGLAKLAAVMANGGRVAERQLLGERANAELHGAPVQRTMMALNTTFTQGGLASFPGPSPADRPLDRGLNQGREGYFGWMGLGGSIFQWHPQLKIGFAYVPTSLNVLDIVNERGKGYQAEMVRCVESAPEG
ncbi:MAG: serine hydrolase domain-containing protein [Pseudomonadales bacterium]